MSPLPRTPRLFKKQTPMQQRDYTMQMMGNLYGSAAPARVRIEEQILGKVGRLPGTGTPSSRLGLQVRPILGQALQIIVIYLLKPNRCLET
jgi:hypothetical protein